MAGLSPIPTIDAVVASCDGDAVSITLPGAAYRLDLVNGQADAPLEPGQRVRVHVEATALRVHVAAGGGRFIEPTEGEPRIVAGHVRSVDQATGSFVLRSVVPMLVRAEDPSVLDGVEPGVLVNFHVRSGATLVVDTA